MEIDKKCVMASIEDVTKPKCGQQVITDSWWVSKDGYVLGYKLYGPNSKERPTPQCNTDRRVVEQILGNLYPDYEAVYLPVAYWPPIASGNVDYWDDKGPKIKSLHHEDDVEDFEIRF